MFIHNNSRYTYSNYYAIMWFDKWKGCNAFNNYWFSHQIFNHSEDFVDSFKSTYKNRYILKI